MTYIFLSFLATTYFRYVSADQTTLFETADIILWTRFCGIRSVKTWKCQLYLSPRQKIRICLGSGDDFTQDDAEGKHISLKQDKIRENISIG